MTKNMNAARLLPGLALLLFAAGAVADVRLPRLLGDGAILQRDIEARVWGWAEEGEVVRVYLDGASAGEAETRNGRWQIRLSPQVAGGPHHLTVEGNNAITLEDIWFGDVWVASGQSNMELPMRRVRERYAEEIAAAGLPLVRQFKVPKSYDFDVPHEDIDSDGWIASTPASVLDFSAVAWFFARSIHARYGVPVGIINSSYGGSPAEGWMSEQALEAWPHYLETAKRFREDGYLAGLQAADKAASGAWHGDLDRADTGLRGDPGFSAMEYDDSGWPSMNVPGYWADTEIGPVNGAVWFRKTIELPDSADGQPAMLRLGRIVDADTVWINGVEVGKTTYQYPPRRYELPAGTLRSGRNTIAVRIVSQEGRGGFVPDKPYRLEVGELAVDLQGAWRYRLGAQSGPLPPLQFKDYRQPLGYYNAMLAPLQNLAIKGVIWYQGETNVDRAAEYERLFPDMIRAWRRQWGQGDFPFLFVQLANFLEPGEVPTESQWAETRNAQAMGLGEPNTAMAVAIDAGEWNDIHPENKRVVGERLALAARKVAYGEEGLVYSGPVPASVTANGGKLILKFDHVGSGLEARGGPLQEFAVAGTDGKYVWATAEIKGDQVAVWSAEVPEPVRVRYAWADNPDRANLYNREGLPAAPFQAGLTNPLQGGLTLIEDLLSRDGYMKYETEDFSGIHYAEVAMAFGALRFLAASGDKEILGRVLDRYRDVPGTEALAAAGHVDASVYGALPLQEYLVTRRGEYLQEGLRFANGQWQTPLENGLSDQSRYWIDDVWMIGILQLQAYRATGERVYLDRAAIEIEEYLRRLQATNGLFYHGPESPFFWGRGNGWVAAGLAELLADLPSDHPRHTFITNRYRQMMQALLRYQAADGMWRQLVDDEGAWKETSATAMFGYAMAVGVRQGILPSDPYAAAYKKTWSALTGYLDSNGRLRDVCVGTGKSADRQYYLDRPRATGDFHGHAPLLWLATELLASPDS